MKKFILFPLIAAVLLAVSPAVAANANGEYSSLAAGIHSCAKVLEDERKDGWPDLINGNWVRGYLTAVGYHLNTVKKFYDVADSAAVDYLIRKYCEENPLDDLDDAARNAADKLLDRAGRR